MALPTRPPGPPPALPPPTQSRIEFSAPAKLNLGLRVVGRRDDGYHLLESLFVPLDLRDDLVVSVTEGESVTIDVTADRDVAAGGGDFVPADASNLAVRAALGFLERAGGRAGVHLKLHKRIPSGAGLGGGSSDAGAVLRALDAAWPDRLTQAELEHVAVSLGADVPFFLCPEPSLVSGIGEARERLPDLPELHFVLANPRVGVATAEVFRRRAAAGSQYTPQGRLRDDIRAVAHGGWASGSREAWSGLLRNDLAEASNELCPAMAPLCGALEAEGALAVGQSGSGASVFGVFADRTTARTAWARLSVNDSAWFRVANSPAAR